PSTTAATYTVPAIANASSYTWALPVGATNITGQGTNTISFIYPAGYTGGTISVSASNGCGSSPLPRTLTVFVLSPATPSVIDVINTAPCPNRVYTYSVAAMPANATSLNWTIPAAGTIVSGQGTTSITVSYPGTAVSGTVTVAAVNNCGSSVTRSVDVKLPACPPPAFASTSNAPSKGTNVAPQVADLDVTVFPNPTVSDFKLQVQTASKEMIHVRVLDMTGREYKVFQLVPGSTLSLGRELKAGSYILEVRQGKSLKTTKVLKF
ncbi:MAG TPA: T9SS type A sorting domain-containing protein, partial [Ferruginibacter sp.]|nr:T9SS type A sorting domain-containing protein [Ferruginibacter sp.]